MLNIKMIKTVQKLQKTFTYFSKSNLKKFSTYQFQHHNEISPEWKSCDFLEKRHLGTQNMQSESTQKLLNKVGVESIEQLIEQVVPPQVLDNNSLQMNGSTIPHALTESQILEHMRELGKKNKLYKTYIGEGFYDTHTPPVILRNVFENPGWYTAYTPYQAEVSQGRLENLLNFQTMVIELTGLDISNASLLDESSAGAETILLADHIHNGKRKKFFISENLFPVTKEVIKSRAIHLGVEIIEANEHTYDFEAEGKQISGVLLQNPDNNGIIHDYTDIFNKVKQQKAVPMLAVDLLSLTMVKTPKEMGAEVAIGNSQRFGVPLGYGGPHAAFMACIDKHKRKLPGRIIGITKDHYGNKCYRMSLQTREQHIKREKATSNICTAQALLANMAGFYGIYHGPKGLKNIAQRVNKLASLFAYQCNLAGIDVLGFNNQEINTIKFFDTVIIKVDDSNKITQYMVDKHQINIRKVDDQHVSFSFDETTSLENIYQLTNIIYQYNGQSTLNEEQFKQQIINFQSQINPELLRDSQYMQQAVFNSYHTETQMMRYLTYLERKDISLNKSMIALGSCTMKLNAASQLIPVTWPEFGKLHPYVPDNQALGYSEMIQNITEYLKIITKFDAFSLQPNSGATGEYSGLLAIKEYLNSIGQNQRDVCIIPISAHGTNPASAVLAGFKTVIVNATKDGQVDVEDLKAKVEKHKNNLGALMVTYPSTCGIYEDKIIEIINIIHNAGGQVYMDGANMNAQVGYTSPGFLGADVCHLNLHKTFAIPHGGGGPGLGPIGVKKHLEPFLPSHSKGSASYGGSKNVVVAQSPYSSASIIPITYSYIRQLGCQGLKNSTALAILNANYLFQKLKDHYQIVYERNGRCAHEFIIDIRPFKHLGIQGIDVAKRLQDFSFHAPTMSFPIPNTLMIEPTESEDIEELDRLAEALIFIRKEIQMIENGQYNQEDNPLVNSPHTQEYVLASEWSHPYSREIAAYPLQWVQKRGKQWPTVGRSDEAYGDRNFIGQQEKELTF